MIPYGRQSISEEDVEAVVAALRSDFLTQGPLVPEFERQIASYCHSKFAIASNSATSALHLACLALGVGTGDRVWTSANTFVASANCARYCGAEVDFVDIDPNTFNMSVQALTEKLELAYQSDALPKVIIPVHFAGQSCDMQRIGELSEKYGFRVIEDASHAIGARYLEEPVGNCRFSDISVFSFHPVKVITSAEGGVCTTNDEEIANRMDLYRTHGITRDPECMTKEPDGGWYYQQIDLGFNYRLSELHAALGISQLSRLDNFVAVRNQIADDYRVELDSLPISMQQEQSFSYSSFHLFVIRINQDPGQKSRSQIYEELRKAGIGVNVHYIPPYMQPYYTELGFEESDFPQARAYYSAALSLPIYPDLSQSQHQYVCQSLGSVLSR